ncbi:MAG: AAA family ATPase [Anaerolineales bacterium]|nr:AAA family ATPase [Anaerolineales bacterium]
MELFIQLLGGFGVQIDGHPLNLAHIARLQLLLAYLALHPSPTPRAQAAFQLWPGSSEKQALTNLRKLLHHLRQDLPKELQLLEMDARQLWLREARDVRVDLVEFKNTLELADRYKRENQAEAEQTALQQAAARYTGDLLPGSYEEWVIYERGNLKQEFIHAADRLVTLLEERRRYHEAVQIAERLLRADTLSEEAYRRLIHLHALNGDRAAALGVYHSCAETLSTQLGVEPDEATRQLYKRLFHKVGAPESPAPPITHPLVGRENEWKDLNAAWQQANAGGIRLHILHGEAGIGKTRLAEEFLLWAKRQGITTASAVCYESDLGNSFAPLVAWLRAQPLQTLTPNQRCEVGRIMPELLVEGDVAPAPIREGWQQIGFFDALSQALLDGEQSLILLLDDMHWCDRDTLDWLKYLIRTRPGANILIVATLREEESVDPAPVISLCNLLRQQDRLSESSLPRLDAQQTAALATSIGGRGISDGIIFHESEGVPLFIVEMARSNLDITWTERGSFKAFSPRLQATLVRRLERLNEPARLLAQAIAALGREFCLPLISAVAGMAETEAMLALDELWQRRIVRETGSGKYYLSHERLGEAALLNLSPVRRRWLHLQAARALEQSGEDHGLVAGHYAEAGETSRAAQAFSKAAQHAASLFALEEARNLVERALALEERPGYEMHELNGDILNLMGLLRQASEAYGRALVACRAADWQTQARLHRRILNCVTRVDYDSARNAYQQGSADLLKAPQREAAYWEEWLELHLSWMRANYFTVNTGEVERILQTMEKPLERWGTPLQKIQYRHNILLHDLLLHRFTATAEQVHIAQQNAAAARDLHSPFQLAEHLSSLGFIAFMAEDFEQSQRAYQESLAVAEAQHMFSIMERCYAYLSLLYRRRKQPSQASGMLERLAQTLEQTNLHVYLMLVTAQRAWLAHLSGDVETARLQADEALKGWGQEKMQYPLQWAARMTLLALEVQEQRWELAGEQAQALLQPTQQRLSPTMTSALQAALDCGGKETPERWQQAIATAKLEGYL